MSERKLFGFLKNPRQLLRTILQLEDTHHSIALGTAIGMFIGLTPTVGAQMMIVIIFAFLTKRFFHFNRLAALVTVYISNPLTMVPIYYGLYWVGTWFVPGTVTKEQFAAILEYDSFATWWQTIVTLFVNIGKPLFIGTAIVATLGGLVTYPVIRWLLSRMQKQPNSHSSECIRTDPPSDANPNHHKNSNEVVEVQSNTFSHAEKNGKPNPTSNLLKASTSDEDNESL